MDLAKPTGLRFSCTQCGDCCRGWTVPLGPGEAESLDRLDWRGKVERLVGARTTAGFRDARGSSRRRLKLRAGGACVYLGEDNGCLIHRHFGGDAKPLLCRLYPLSIARLGKRAAVAVSFACRSVSSDAGAPIEDSLAEAGNLLQALGESAGSLAPALAGSRKLDPTAAWDFEHLILELLNEAAFTLPRRIEAVARFLEMIAGSDPSAPRARDFRVALVAGLRKRLSASDAPALPEPTPEQHLLFRQWLYLVLNPPVAGSDEGDAPAESAERARRESESRAWQEGTGNPIIQGTTLRVDFGTIARQPLGWLTSGACAGLFSRWLSAKILGQQFLQTPAGPRPFVDGMAEFLVFAPAVVWTSQGLSAHRGAASVEECDVREAIRRLDRAAGLVAFPQAGKVGEASRFLVVESQLAARVLAQQFTA